MIKACALIFLLVVAPKVSFSQEVKKPSYYKYIFDPKAGAAYDISQAVTHAKASHKRVLVIVGGDWDGWSRLAAHDMTKSPERISNYELVLVNYSPVNRNEPVLASLPAR